MQNSKTFSLEVERLAKEKNITHMEAVLEHCRIQEIEPDSVTRLITKSLKDKNYSFIHGLGIYDFIALSMVTQKMMRTHEE